MRQEYEATYTITELPPRRLPRLRRRSGYLPTPHKKRPETRTETITAPDHLEATFLALIREDEIRGEYNTRVRITTEVAA